MRIQIQQIHRIGAFYEDREKIVGEFGILHEERGPSELGFKKAHIQMEGKPNTHFFYAVRYKEVK